jgi:hypothetical protein
MLIARSIPIFLTLFALALCACRTSSEAGPTPLTTIPTTPGGIIEYGVVSGATTLPAAMASVLSQVHQACGEKPRVGQVFRVKGTNSAGVFFTVIDHAQNRQLAGMVIAAQGGPNDMEAAVVSDATDKFAQTMNPMLQQLFAAWHPGQGVQTTSTSSRASGASAPAGVAMHAVTAADNSASMSVPDGWTLNSQSGRGAIIVQGPKGELIALDMMRTAIDPTNPFQVNMARQHYNVIAPGTLVYAFRGDLTKEFVNVFQAWRKAGGQGPAPITVSTLVTVPAGQGDHCVHVTGQVNPDGKGMQAFNDMMCAIDPIASFGGYSVMLNHTLLPAAVENTEQDLEKAIVSSYKENTQVVNQQMAAQARAKQQSDQQIEASAQAYIGRFAR